MPGGPGRSRGEITLVIAGAFYVSQRKYPYVSFSDVMGYEAFEAYADYIKTQKTVFTKGNFLFGGLLYDVGCYENGFAEVVLDILLGEHADYEVMAIFTSANGMELQRAAFILQVNKIPLFKLSEQENIHKPATKEGEEEEDEIDLDYDKFHIINILKRNTRSTLNAFVAFQRHLNITEANYATDPRFTNNDDRAMASEVEEILANQHQVCFVSRLESPTTEGTEFRLNMTLKYSRVDSTFIVYSQDDEGITNLMNLVHTNHPKRNFTWITTTLPRYRSLTNSSKQNSRLLFLKKDYNIDKKLGLFMKDFNKRVVNDVPWLRASLGTSWWKMPLYKFANTLFREKISSLELWDNAMNKGLFQILARASIIKKTASNRYNFDTFYKEIYTLKKYFPGFLSKQARLIMNNNTHILPEGRKICSDECEVGTRPSLINKRVECCWNCVKCPMGYIRPDLKKPECERCPSDTMSDNKRVSCQSYVRVTETQDKSLVIACYFISSVGALICVLIIIVFWANRKTPLIKASDLHLAMPQLSAHVLLFLAEIVSVTSKNSSRICYTKPFVKSCLWALSCSITLVKTQKLLMIFSRKLRQTSRDVKATKVFVAGTIVSCQTVVFTQLIMMEVYSSISVFKIKRDNHNIIEYVSCHTFPFDRFTFAFIEILLSLCLVQSYRARKLPANFNETKHIAVAVLCTEVFLLSYLIAGGDSIASEVILMECANISMVFIMFGNKLFIIVFHPELNKKSILDRQLIQMSTSEKNRKSSESAFVQ